MRRFLSLLLLLLLVFPAVRLCAQQFNFRNYSVADGLAQSQVFALAEDTRGYLWAGTRGGGVSRFDGQQFTTFSEEDSLPGNFVRCLAVAPDGAVWAGTDEGVAFFDGARFRRVPLPGNAGLVNAIAFSRNGAVWVATEDTGVVVLKNELVTAHYYYRHGLPTDRTHSLFEDRDGSMWIGTENGLVHLRNGKAVTLSALDGLPEKSIRAITRDGNGQLWLATYGAGLVRMDTDKNRLFRFVQEDGLPNNTVHDLVADAQGRLWVATASGAACISKTSDGYTAKLFTELEGLCSNVVMRLLCDSWGNTWFGTSGGGICRLDGERFLHFTEKSGRMGTWVYAVHADRAGNVWFGTSAGGVTMYDGTYYVNYLGSAGFTTSKVRCISEDTSGTLWMGTVGDGAYSFREGSFRHYNREAGLVGSFVNDILTDTMGHIWFSTSGGGLSRFDPVAERFERIGKKQGVTADRFQQLCLDQQGNVWAASASDGVYVFSTDSTGVRLQRHIGTANGLATGAVRAVICDRSGTVWLGTAGGGVYRCGKQLTAFTKKNGLASDNIYLLQEDAQGQLWAGSERGLDRLRFDGQGKLLQVKHYGKGEGLAGIEVSLNASCMDRAGQLWFGTIYGATRYNPKADVDNRTPPQAHITGIRLFFSPIQETPFADSLSPNWFGLPDSLVLPHTQNSLRFEFTGIDLRNPDGVRFRWRLEGFDREWSPENTERQATYSNLPPGDYVFRMQARNADGFWSAAQEFHFRITSPFWATWPFRIAVGIGVVLVLALLFRWQFVRLKRRNRARVAKLKLEKHVLELEQKALRLQMNPHFIFNALQSIQGFIARNDSAEARRYLAKFGKLMRLTLDNSRQPWTNVAAEAELLQHYLTLEALCLDNRFTFAIHTAALAEPAALYLPVMLIQPFAENAVVHGLRHKPEGGQLSIDFRMEGQTLVIRVRDNGVGRTKAAELERSEVKQHESAALDITRDRLKQLNEPGKPESGYVIRDLAEGTEVEIRIGAVSYEL